MLILIMILFIFLPTLSGPQSNIYILVEQQSTKNCDNAILKMSYISIPFFTLKKFYQKEVSRFPILTVYICAS
jgi:hypothetical protein